MSFPMREVTRQAGLLLVVLFVVIGGAVATEIGKKSYTGYKLFSVRQNDQRQMDFLRQLQQAVEDLDFWKLDRVPGSEAHVLVPPEQVQTFQTLLAAEQIAHREIIADYSRTTDDYMFASVRSMSRKNPILTKYLRYQEMVDYLHKLTLRHSNVVTVSSIGKSSEGRDIPAVTIRSPSFRARPNASQPVVFVDAGIHAREWAAPATAMYLISELVENAAQHADLLEGLSWTIVPIVNPDGYEYSHEQQRLWRKTRRQAGSSCYGIDGNRNFDFHWAEVGSSNMPCADSKTGARKLSTDRTDSAAGLQGYESLVDRSM